MDGEKIPVLPSLVTDLCKYSRLPWVLVENKNLIKYYTYNNNNFHKTECTLACRARDVYKLVTETSITIRRQWDGETIKNITQQQQQDEIIKVQTKNDGIYRGRFIKCESRDNKKEIAIFEENSGAIFWAFWVVELNENICFVVEIFKTALPIDKKWIIGRPLLYEKTVQHNMDDLYAKYKCEVCFQNNQPHILVCAKCQNERYGKCSYCGKPFVHFNQQTCFNCSQA